MFSFIEMGGNRERARSRLDRVKYVQYISMDCCVSISIQLYYSDDGMSSATAHENDAPPPTCIL